MRKQTSRNRFNQNSVIEKLYLIDDLLYEFKRDRRCDTFSSSAYEIFKGLASASRQRGLYDTADISENVALLFCDIKLNNVNCYEKLRRLAMVMRIEILDQLDDSSDGIQILRGKKGKALVDSFREELKLYERPFLARSSNHIDVLVDALTY